MNPCRMQGAEQRWREAETPVFREFVCRVRRFQLAGGRRFLHEHPSGAQSWRGPSVACLFEDTRVGSAGGHQRLYGQVARQAASEEVYSLDEFFRADPVSAGPQ
eukprot:6585404-Alexandrium_andersonii.AAC.1